MWSFNIKVDNQETTVIAVAKFCDIVENNINLTEDIIDKFERIDINEKLLEKNLIPGIRKTIEKLVDSYKH